MRWAVIHHHEWDAAPWHSSDARIIDWLNDRFELQLPSLHTLTMSQASEILTELNPSL